MNCEEYFNKNKGKDALYKKNTVGRIVGYSGDYMILGFCDSNGCIKSFNEEKVVLDYSLCDDIQSFRFAKPDYLYLLEFKNLKLSMDIKDDMLVIHRKTGKKYMVFKRDAKMKNPDGTWSDAVIYIPMYPNECKYFIREKIEFLSQFVVDENIIEHETKPNGISTLNVYHAYFMGNKGEEQVEIAGINLFEAEKTFKKMYPDVSEYTIV